MVGQAKQKIEWGSHLGVLINAVMASKGPIVECGSGFYSTPALHWLAAYYGRDLITLESNYQFYLFNKAFEKGLHRVEFVKSWPGYNFEGHYGLAFVDCNPIIYRRAVINKLKDKAEIIVVHDTQEKPKAKARYKYDEIYPLFKYRFDYRGAFPNTSILSNCIDVKQLFKGK